MNLVPVELSQVLVCTEQGIPDNAVRRCGQPLSAQLIWAASEQARAAGSPLPRLRRATARSRGAAVPTDNLARKRKVCSIFHRKANNFNDHRLGPRSATPQRWREDCCPGERTDDEMGKWALRFSFGVCVYPSHALLHKYGLDKTGATAAIASTLSG